MYFALPRGCPKSTLPSITDVRPRCSFDVGHRPAIRCAIKVWSARALRPHACGTAALRAKHNSPSTPFIANGSHPLWKSEIAIVVPGARRASIERVQPNRVRARHRAMRARTDISARRARTTPRDGADQRANSARRRRIASKGDHGSGFRLRCLARGAAMFALNNIEGTQMWERCPTSSFATRPHTVAYERRTTRLRSRKPEP